MKSDTAIIQEIFSSAQGEGPYVGYLQLFIRFFGCHLNCAYCDTPNTITARQPKLYSPPTFLVENSTKTYSNPISVDDFIAIVGKLTSQNAKHHSIALTGGEPLLNAKFLTKALPILKAQGHVIYLETSGDLPKPLEQVIDFVDIISMDFKLESATNAPTPWDKHAEFLQVSSIKETFVKIVISNKTTEDEILKTTEIINSVNPAIPLILQPAIKTDTYVNSPSAQRCLDLLNFTLNLTKDVRLIPQTHKFIGIR